MEVGKSAKKMGKKGPRDARHPHPDREKVTPKASGVKKEKRYGFQYEYHFGWWKGSGEEKWVVEKRWYTTKAGRDMALKKFRRQIADWSWYRKPEEIPDGA